MQTRAVSVVIGLLLTACAATTPAPRFSAVSPADAGAPEAATPPPTPALAGEAEVEGVKPSAPLPTDEVYSCLMHPEVKQAAPGTCPKCGMKLAKRNDARPQP